MDLRPLDTFAPKGVEAVALDEEMLKRPRLGTRDGATRLVFGEEARGRQPPVVALGTEGEPVTVPPAAHPRPRVRKGEESARRLDEQAARRVEAEEPDPRLAVERDVRPDVQLERRREHGQRRDAVRSESTQAKRRHAQPRV